MTVIVPAFFGGVVAGLRSMTAPAAVSWGVRMGALPLRRSPLRVLGFPAASRAMTALAVGELVADKLPVTPSRKEALGFSARLLTGALSGAAIGASRGETTKGMLAGLAGAVAGTLVGHDSRTALVRATGGRDWPVALLEDGIAVGVAACVIVGCGRRAPA